MSNESDLLSIRDEIVPDPIPYPAYPVGPCIMHGEVLYKLAVLHKSALVDPRYDWEKNVEKIPVFCGATRQASSLWQAVQFEKPESRSKWTKFYTEAEILVTRLLYIMRYAFQGNDALLGQLTALNPTESNQQFIQTLNDIAVVGRNNLEKLNATPKFDEAMLARAAELSDLMGDLYATVIVDKSLDNALKLDRDKAYYLLDKALHDLVAYAKAVFADKKEIARLFTIEPTYREGGRGTSKKSKEKTPEPSPVAS